MWRLITKVRAKPKRLSKIPSAILLPIIIVVTVLATLATVHLVQTNTHQNTGRTEQQKVVAEVGKLLLLPTNEDPSLGSVTDVSKLKDQPFFANAKDGDKLLIYLKAQETILYRPDINKIINVGPIISGTKGSPYVTSSIAILNGSGNDSLLAKMTSAVISAFPNSSIVAKDIAPRLFPTSIAIDLTKKNQPLDEQIADTLGIKTGQVPLGINPASSADILIIIGQDYK